MKKNLLIMMMMVLCAGFASAQTVSTVRGFVPGGSTGAMNNDTYATYATFAQPFATMVNNNGHEVTVGLAQMQLVTDSITDVISCNEGYQKNGFNYTAEQLQEILTECEMEGSRAYLRKQTPNAADQDYYYDSLVVVDLYVCPCTASDGQNEYDVIALNGECWFKTNMRKDIAGSMVYNSELNTVDPENEEDMITFGRLYTYETVINGATCEDGFVQGICPEKWHLPSVEEMDPLFALPAENLRIDGNWIVDGNNNMTEFSAQPAGYYNSISQRFEGMLTETDFWMVDCNNLNPENGQLPVFQLIYSCNTPLRPNRPVDDAISVRCVYDIVKMLEDCEPELDPNSCPTLGNVNLINTADGIGFTAHINNYVSGTTATVNYTAGYDMSTVPGTAGSTTPDFGSATPQIDVNGDFTWLYEPAQGYDIQYLTGITANVEITTEDDCNKQSGNFNVYQKNETPQTECDFTVGPADLQQNGQYFIPVTNYDYEDGDAFTVTCVFNVGNIEQSLFEEHAAGDGTGYRDGILVVNLGDVPTYYCGLSFKIKLNNSCEETVIALICE